MQRLYAMFPDRGPGIGLLLLRLELALMLLLDPLGRWLDAGGPWPMALAWLAALLLGLGLMAPLALLIAVLVTLPRVPEPLALCILAHAAGLMLLGPGAFSVDARLFGRRVVHADVSRRQAADDPKE